MVACDYFVVITATFRILYVFIVTEIGSRQILHHNVTAHPTAEWTLHQFREALPGNHPYRFVIHDRDRIFSADVDKARATEQWSRHAAKPRLRSRGRAGG